MAYSVNAVVNTLLELAKDKNINDMTPMKIQKLVYYAQAWYLKLNGRDKPLIDEHFSRWDHGPVIPSLYHSLKSYGYYPVTNKVGYLDRTEDRMQYITPSIDDDKTISFLSEIIKVFGKYNAQQLSSMTHQEGTAWIKGGADRSVITFDEMIEEVSEPA